MADFRSNLKITDSIFELKSATFLPFAAASRPVIRPTPDLACRALASASSMGYGPRFALTRSAYVGWSARANPASARSASARRSASVEQGRISK